MMNIKHPVIARLSELEKAAETGVLSLGENGTWEIFVQKGLIEYVSGGEELDRLGQLLVEDCVVDKKTVDSLFRGNSSREIMGARLRKKEAARPQHFKNTLKRQVLGRFERLLKEESLSTDNFRRSAPHGGFPLQAGYKALLLELARRRGKEKTFRLDQTFSIRSDEMAELDRWPWRPDEVAAVSQLARRPFNLNALAENMKRSPAQAKQILETLHALGLLAPHKTEHEMDYSSAENSLGLIPRVHANYSPKLLLRDQDQSFVREQFRTLKVRLSRYETTGKAHVITISSPFIEEGKSLLSANLALVCAEDEARRVLLIDGDLRRSSVSTYLGVEQVPGVSDFLTQEGLEAHCFMRRSGKLFWMSSGFTAPNPVELLSSERMAELIEYARQHFDVVIIDCPPLEPVSDAGILTDLADGLVLVVRSGKTSYASAERALRNVDADKVLGVVLNDVKPMLFNTYYGQHYYHSGEHAYPSIQRDSE